MIGTPFIYLDQLFDTFIGKGSSSLALIVGEFRVPRLLISLLAGACLGVSGYVLQGGREMNWQILAYWGSMRSWISSDALFRFLFTIFSAVSVASRSLYRWYSRCLLCLSCGL